MKRIVAFAAALLMLLLAACTPEQTGESQPLPESSEEERDQNYPVTVAGVTLDKAPQRVVALTPALAEVVAGLGYHESLCGVTDICGSLELDGVTMLGDQYTLNFDRLAALAPELILTQIVSDDLAAWAKKNTVPVICLAPPTDRESLRSFYTDVATALGGSLDGVAAAQLLYTAVTGELMLLSNKIPMEDAAAKVLYLADATGAVATGDTLWQLLFDTLAVTNVASDGEGWVAPQDMDTPDVVFCPESLVDQVEKTWKRADVVVLDKNIALFAGRTLSETACTMALELYPDAMAEEEVSAEENSDTASDAD